MAESRLLYVPLTLASQPDNRDRDHDIVSALWSPGAGWFTHVMLVVPSWQEQPDAATHPLVRSAIAACHSRGIRVYWTRWLWVAYVNGVLKHLRPHASSHKDPAYYAAALAIVQHEALMLGVYSCGFDGEPYGPDDAPQRAALRGDLTDYTRMMMQVAVMQATNAVGRVDLIYPFAWMNEKSYVWPVGLLGREGMTSLTYYADSPEALAAQARLAESPPGYDDRFTYWGIHVGKPGDFGGTNLPLITAADVVAMDFSETGAICTAYPSVKGPAVYTPVKKLAAMIREWPR